MALTKSLFDLTATPCGGISKEFMAHTPTSWAQEHMYRRYGHAVPREGEGVNHPARLCFNHLMEEHRTIMSWFPQGVLSQLLMGRHMAGTKKGPLGAGYSWDFRANGDVEPAMLQFKAAMISATRAMEALPPKHRVPENLTVSSMANLVRDAARTRANAHDWRSVEKVDRVSDEEAATKLVLTGADLCSRWVALRTYNFLIDWIDDRGWCWIVSKCGTTFGPVDAQ